MLLISNIKAILYSKVVLRLKQNDWILSSININGILGIYFISFFRVIINFNYFN